MSRGYRWRSNPIPHYWLIGILRFLLVSLNIGSILQESTIHRRREQLSKITDGLGLGDAYGATIERIKAQDGDKSTLGMGALMWVCHAERPLKVDELCYALAVELGSTDFNPQNLPSIQTLVSCRQGLITVDKEASTARLIHFTLKEYLCAHPDIFGRHHSIMAEICLTYLNSEKVKALSLDGSPLILDTPFLTYCSRYWGVHAKRDFSNRVKSLALELLQGYDSHISARSLLAHVRYLGHWRQGMSFQFSGLHCASFFGIEEGVVALIGIESYGINEGDIWGGTPLAWAAERGHEGVVKILLGRADVNPDKADNDGHPPLSHAASGGHEGVVKVLLERGEVNPDRPNNYGRTPLHSATLGGHEGVVKVLLERAGVSHDRADNDGSTPLSHAARSGHEGVVKVLLERAKVDPNKPDNLGVTALLRAARYGHDKVVKILLAHAVVNPDKPDHHGSTPLLAAAQFGYENIVKMLLGREEVNHEKRDNDGDTPLTCAARYGHQGVVIMLLEKARVNLDNINHAGQTPLIRTALNGHQRVIELLKLHQTTTSVTASGSGDTTR